MLSEKKLSRFQKILGETIQELDAQDTDALKQSIVRADQSIKQASDELEANPKFQELKESLKAVSEGLREVKKRQNAIVQYSLHLIEEKGKNNV